MLSDETSDSAALNTRNIAISAPTRIENNVKIKSEHEEKLRTTKTNPHEKCLKKWPKKLETIRTYFGLPYSQRKKVRIVEKTK